MYQYVGSISGSGQWCDVLEPPIRVQLAVSRCPAPGRPATICQHPSRQTGHWWALGRCTPHYPRETIRINLHGACQPCYEIRVHRVLINSGASVNNRWNEARYLDVVDIPDIYYQKQSQTLCIKKIYIFNTRKKAADGRFFLGPAGSCLGYAQLLSFSI